MCTRRQRNHTAMATVLGQSPLPVTPTLRFKADVLYAHSAQTNGNSKAPPSLSAAKLAEDGAEGLAG